MARMTTVRANYALHRSRKRSFSEGLVNPTPTGSQARRPFGTLFPFSPTKWEKYPTQWLFEIHFNAPRLSSFVILFSNI